MLSMTTNLLKRSRWLTTAAIVAVIFGLLTVVSGGNTLFNAAAQQAAGDYVGFVLWFNFLAGFAYIVAGVGLWQQQRWSVWLAVAIAAATVLVFAAFGWHIFTGGSYETRTVAAMSLRSIVWCAIAGLAYKELVG